MEDIVYIHFNDWGPTSSNEKYWNKINFEDEENSPKTVYWFLDNTFCEKNKLVVGIDIVGNSFDFYISALRSFINDGYDYFLDSCFDYKDPITLDKNEFIQLGKTRKTKKDFSTKKFLKYNESNFGRHFMTNKYN